MFYGAFRGKDSLACQKITLWKENGITSKSRNYRRTYNTLFQFFFVFESGYRKFREKNLIIREIYKKSIKTSRLFAAPGESTVLIHI